MCIFCIKILFACYEIEAVIGGNSVYSGVNRPGAARGFAGCRKTGKMVSPSDVHMEVQMTKSCTYLIPRLPAIPVMGRLS